MDQFEWVLTTVPPRRFLDVLMDGAANVMPSVA